MSLHRRKYWNDTMCWLNRWVLTPELKAFSNVLACKEYYTELLTTSAAKTRQQTVKESTAALSIIKSLGQHQLLHADGILQQYSDERRD